MENTKINCFLSIPMICALFILNGCSTTGSHRAKNEIIIEKNGHCTSITVQGSKLAVILIGGNWKRQKVNGEGGTKHPRYFFLSDKWARLYLSGWFEPEHLFTSVQQLWHDTESRKVKRGSEPSQNVIFQQIDDWQVVMYDHFHKGVTNSNIVAHLVKSGTWIDLHLSTVTKKSQEQRRERLKKTLKNIRVIIKKFEHIDLVKFICLATTPPSV